MKLLLTSAGLTNISIARAFAELVGKSPEKTSIAFIPTAANMEEGDKGWLIDDLSRLKKEGYSIDIVDISAISKDIWEPRLKAADTLFFGGGNTFHLMYWIRKSGLLDMLPELLKTRVYAGISAGSMVTGPSLSLSNSDHLYYEDVGQYTDESAMGFVPFQIRPHLNSPFFPKVTLETLEADAKNISDPFYALDDQSAVKVIDGKTEVVSEGVWQLFN